MSECETLPPGSWLRFHTVVFFSHHTSKSSSGFPCEDLVLESALNKSLVKKHINEQLRFHDCASREEFVVAHNLWPARKPEKWVQPQLTKVFAFSSMTMYSVHQFRYLSRYEKKMKPLLLLPIPIRPISLVLACLEFPRVGFDWQTTWNEAATETGRTKQETFVLPSVHPSVPYPTY